MVQRIRVEHLTVSVVTVYCHLEHCTIQKKKINGWTTEVGCSLVYKKKVTMYTRYKINVYPPGFMKTILITSARGYTLCCPSWPAISKVDNIKT